jgi:diguanylate cyclase (GGDEF)-like protein/PAS domain S-box-containing protein
MTDGPTASGAGGWTGQPAMVGAWLLILALLLWFGWRDLQEHDRNRQAMAQQAAIAGAQITALYLQELKGRLLQILEQQEGPSARLQQNSGKQNAVQRLARALRLNFPHLQGFALTDREGLALMQQPAHHLDASRVALLQNALHRSGNALALSVTAESYLFDLAAPWYLEGDMQGRLLVTLGCGLLCPTLASQAPPGHRLELIADSATGPASGLAASAPVPGTGWAVGDRIDPALRRQRLYENLALGLLFVVLFMLSSSILSSRIRRRERAAGRNDGHYRDLFEQSPEPRLLAAADDGSILAVDRAAEDLFEHPEARLKQHGLQDLLRFDRAALTRALESPIGTAQPLPADYTSVAGDRRELELRVRPLKGAQPPVYQVTLQDVTDLNRSQAELRESEQKLHAILNVSTDGILLTDEAGRIQVFSPGAEMMFGYLKEQTLGRHLRLLMPRAFGNGEEAGPADWIPPDLAIAGQGAVREVTGLRENGEQVPIRVSLSRVELGNGRQFVVLVQDLSEQRRNQRQLAWLERHDLLTGLLSRREMERRLDALLSFSEQPETEYVLCHMDIDQFKLVNDTCGHAAGDQLLKQLAVLVQAQLKESEIVARIGGDEFGALLTDCSLERGEAICHGLLQTVRNFLFTWRDRSFDVAISIGLAAFRPHSDQASLVLSQADVACHMAKRMGRDRLHVYHQGDAELIRHHGDMHLVSVINLALNEGRFFLYAQPIVPVAPGRQGEPHYEILVRMVDRSGRLVIPEHFIPAAERYILMPAIDRWVIGRLFDLQAHNLRRWSRRHGGGGGFLFGINLSGTSLAEEGFLTYLKRQFTGHEVPPDAICFEITETAAMASLDRARKLIREMRALGCSFALDDFGTGLSSYAYLKQLPVDYLKIDGSFVRNMTDDPVDYAMVDSINQIGHILGLKTIAEWAENPGTLTQLRALNVDYAQGFGVGDMVAVEEFQLPDAGSEAPT